MLTLETPCQEMIDSLAREPSPGRSAKDHVGEDESGDTVGALCALNFVLLFKDKELAIGACIFPGERHQIGNRVSHKGEFGVWRPEMNYPRSQT